MRTRLFNVPKLAQDPPSTTRIATREDGQVVQDGAPGPAVLDVPIMDGSFALTVIAVLGVVFLLKYAQELFIPVALAVLVAYSLDPAVTFVARARLPRVVATTIVLVGLLAGLGWGGYAMRGQAIATIESLPVAAQKLRQKIQEIRASSSREGAMDKIQQAANELEKAAKEAAGPPKPAGRGVTKVQIEEAVFRANDYLWSGSLGFVAIAGQAILVIFLVFFLLASGDLFKRKLVRLAGTRLSQKRMTVETLNEINAQIGRFLMVLVFTAAIVGLLTGLALWWFGIDQPAVLGVAAGLFNTIPYFGPLIVTAGVALAAFLQFGSLAAVVKIAGTAWLITTLEGFLLTPALMGKAARINGVAMFVSILFWSWLWGVIGMVVAVPIMMVIKTVCDRIEELQPVGELLGER